MRVKIKANFVPNFKSLMRFIYFLLYTGLIFTGLRAAFRDSAHLKGHSHRARGNGGRIQNFSNCEISKSPFSGLAIFMALSGVKVFVISDFILRLEGLIVFAGGDADV